MVELTLPYGLRYGRSVHGPCRAPAELFVVAFFCVVGLSLEWRAIISLVSSEFYIAKIF